LRVIWPDGQVNEFAAVRMGVRVTLDRQSGSLKSQPLRRPL
jgi:hypothetical protein